MKFISRTLTLILCSFSLLSVASGQFQPTLENGVTPHKGIDKIYSAFSEGYATLDASKVAGLYSLEASYVPPSSNAVNGRAAILENFQSFFSGVRQRGQKMDISFSIEKRRLTKNLGYDIGVFEITFSKDGSVTGSSKGRFVVVTVKDKDGRWRFDVDAYTPLEDN